MPFKRYVEVGRVALVNYGKDYGRLVVIVDVIDQNRVLVDAPDMVRGQMNLKRLSLTDITVQIEKVPKKSTLIAAMETADVKNKWENSSWGRKLIVQKKRAALNDFDRFKIMLAKIKELSLKSLFKGGDEVNKRDYNSKNMKKPSWMMPITHGYYLVEDRTRDLESSELEKQDTLVVQREEISNLELWFFSLSGSVIGDSISNYMHSHLFSRQLKESQVISKSKEAMKKVYLSTKAKVESEISERTVNVASTSVIIVNGERLVMAQMGGYRVIVCRDGIAHQLHTKHQHTGNMHWPHRLISGVMRIPKVHIQACHLSRQSSRKQNNSTELVTVIEKLDSDTEFLILASTGVFEVMRNQEAVDLIWHIDDPQEAAECLAREALSRMSKGTISCLVIRFD
ncbi:hypothetical protein KSS87_004952 [Heliosperma pusillum]|nr:hypothetical protein KSS87_004952 [Heliosperma pusillum]